MRGASAASRSEVEGVRALHRLHAERSEKFVERFYVKAGSVNAVRRALGRAPGGARVLGRYDRETIECSHTMEAHSLDRHWPILVSRLEKAGLTVVPRPGSGPDGAVTTNEDSESRTDTGSCLDPGAS